MGLRKETRRHLVRLLNHFLYLRRASAGIRNRTVIYTPLPGLWKWNQKHVSIDSIDIDLDHGETMELIQKYYNFYLTGLSDDIHVKVFATEAPAPINDQEDVVIHIIMSGVAIYLEDYKK